MSPELVQNLADLSDPSDRISLVVWHGLVDVSGLGECSQSLVKNVSTQILNLDSSFKILASGESYASQMYVL